MEDFRETLTTEIRELRGNQTEMNMAITEIQNCLQVMTIRTEEEEE